MADLFQDLSKDLDVPIVTEEKAFWKKGKIRIIIIFEDQSFVTYFRKAPGSYTFSIKKRFYFYSPIAVLKGDPPTVIYAFNNPMPFFLCFELSQMNGLDIRTVNQINKLSPEQQVTLKHTRIDSEAVQLGFNTRVFRGLYGVSGITAKVILIILGAVLVVVLIILQVTCKADFLKLDHCKKAFVPLGSFLWWWLDYGWKGFRR
jgi:hypothetical protein